MNTLTKITKLLIKKDMDNLTAMETAEEIVSLIRTITEEVIYTDPKGKQMKIGEDEHLPPMEANPYLWSERNARNYLRKEQRTRLDTLLGGK